MSELIPTVLYGPNGEAETFDHPADAPDHYCDTPAKARALALGVEVTAHMSNEDIVAACYAVGNVNAKAEREAAEKAKKAAEKAEAKALADAQATERAAAKALAKAEAKAAAEAAKNATTE